MRLFKKIKPAYLALIMIIIFFGSTLATGFLQSAFFRTETRQTLEIPQTNIVEYELTEEQEEYIMSYGKTIIKYKYQSPCVECLSFKSMLESLTNQFSDQLFLEEITGDYSVPEVVIMSYYGQEKLDNPTQDEVIDVVCELMINPPTVCAVRKV